MKRIKFKKNGKRSCTFCAPKEVEAIFMTSGMASPIEFACDKHKDKLAKPDDGYMSEGDHQSWGRLR